MTDTNRTPIEPWTRKRAALLAAVCMMAGIAGGWLIRGAQSPAVIGAAKAAIVSTLGVTASLAPRHPVPPD